MVWEPADFKPIRATIRVDRFAVASAELMVGGQLRFEPMTEQDRAAIAVDHSVVTIAERPYRG
jgi:hypothetical protein